MILPPPAPEVVARARAFRAAGAAPAQPAPSATVILLRDGAQGLETFMIRRLRALSFAGGMHVFPGGVLDPSDMRCAGVEEPLVATAIRETFEESGLLLASGDVSDPAGSEAESKAELEAELGAELEADRLALVEHSTSLGAVLERHGLRARPDALRPWSRWITPEFEPRRYDTLFFVAAAVDGQEARDLGGESDVAEWVRPADALAHAERGDWQLMLPTGTTLRELLPYRGAEEVFEAAAQRDVRTLCVTIDLDADPPKFALS